MMSWNKKALSSAALKYMGMIGGEKDQEVEKIDDQTFVLARHHVDEEKESSKESFMENDSFTLMSDENRQLEISTSIEIEQSEMEVEQSLVKETQFTTGNFDGFGSSEVDESSKSDPASSREIFKTPPSKRRKIMENFLDPTSFPAKPQQNFSMLTEDLFNASMLPAVSVIASQQKMKNEEFFSELSRFDCTENYKKNENFADFSREKSFNNATSSCIEFPQLSPSTSRKKEVPESFLDESMLPERCRNKVLENTIMQNEKLNVSTFYSSRVLAKSNQIIDSYYKFQRPQDWNAIADQMLEKFEPSIDYLCVKLQAQKAAELGDAVQEIGGKGNVSFDDFRESLEEIEKSFETPDQSFVSSTPTKTNKSSSSMDKSSHSSKCKESQKDSEKVQRISQTEARSSQRNSQSQVLTRDCQPQMLEQPRSLASQRNMKSASDIFADLSNTPCTTQQEFSPSLQFSLTNFDFGDAVNGKKLDNSGSDGGFAGFTVEEQKKKYDTVGPEFIEVLRAEDPVEALQALSQQNPM